MSQLFIIQSPCLGNWLLISPRGNCRSLEIAHQRNTHPSSFSVVQCLKEPWHDRNLLYRRNSQEMPNLWTCLLVLVFRVFLVLVFTWHLLQHKKQFKILLSSIISLCKFFDTMYRWVHYPCFPLAVMLICPFSSIWLLMQVYIWIIYIYKSFNETCKFLLYLRPLAIYQICLKLSQWSQQLERQTHTEYDSINDIC